MNRTRITIEMRASDVSKTIIGLTIIGILTQNEDAQKILDEIIERGSEATGRPIEDSQACLGAGLAFIDKIIGTSWDKVQEKINNE